MHTSIRYIVALLTVLSLALPMSGQQSDRLFEYPTVPDDSVSLMSRTNYLVEHFWDKCNVRSAILSRDRFKEAFIDYVSFMPYADGELVRRSIGRLTEAFAKDDDGALTLAEIAEEVLYDRNGEFVSDEVFVLFARPMLDNKKVKKARKARIAHEVELIDKSAVGAQAPDITYTRPDGSRGRLSDLQGKSVILFINDPDCSDCMITRARLSASHEINEFIDRGMLAVLSISPADYDADWVSSVSHYNTRWEVGANADIDTLIDVREFPTIYFISGNGHILIKDASAEALIETFGNVSKGER